MSTLQHEAKLTVGLAEFRDAWPIEVRKTLVRAAQTEGEFPPYAVKLTEWALKEAHRIERRCAKDIELGEKTLTHAERRRLVGAK